MDSIDIAAIERHARQLRAQEIQRLQGLFAERVRLYGLLLGHSLLSLAETVGEALRPLFSWNPQDKKELSAGRPLFMRLNEGARALFSWNPRKEHSC